MNSKQISPKPKKALTRRDFLERTAKTAALASFPLIVPACVTGRGAHPAPSERVNLGCIGMGNMGTGDMKASLSDDRVQVVAVCDVNRESESGYWAGRGGGREPARRIAEAHYAGKTGRAGYKGVEAYSDFREIVERNDIDAVIIALPVHWHAIPAIMAAESGKDIYGEKPLSLTVSDGRKMSDAVRKNRRVFQCGSQQRSDELFRFSCELVRNSRIGDLRTVKCGLPGGTPDYSKNAHRTATEPIPNGFDYETWLGPAPWKPYSPARTHVNWRWVFDYSGGQVTDWGGHHPDIAQWAMDTEDTGPLEIRNARAKYANHPIYDTASNYYFECVYESGVVLSVSNEHRMGVTFEGTDGWVWVTRGEMDANPKSLLESEIGPGEIHLYKSTSHMRNFIDCVYSREDPIAPAETAHRSITIAHVGNIAMKLSRDLKWNPKKERFVKDAEADAMLSRPYRAPWSV